MKDYKKILEGVVDIINTTEKSDIGFANICAYIGENCPELKESEDEKTKKEIINYLECQRRDEPSRKDTHNKWISYIEKHALSKDDYDFLRDCARILKTFGWQSYADRLTGLCPALGEETKAMMSTPIFPKESGDERIRKEIISMSNTLGKTEWIAWLEKQGEQKSTIEMKSAEESLGIDSDTYNKIVDECIYGEQKPTDVEEVNFFDDFRKTDSEVEPKFHEGDWITNGDYTWQIVEIKPLDYILQSQDGNVVDDTISHVDEQFHSFTIQDAKPGDVFVNQNGEMPFIFKECKNNHIYCYCGYTNRKDIFFDRFVDSEGEELHWLNLYHEQVYPATKDQRDLLFSKMKEAGYEWDTDKKELKKIEQKPAWSEEDERTYESVLYAFEHNYPLNSEQQKFIKSLKYRVQPQQEWSKEDEGYYDAIIAKLEVTREDALLTDNEMDFLKSLEKRILPKSTWNEEDEKVIHCLEYTIRHFYVDEDTIEWCCDWLKSLRPQNRWKPSEEQITWLYRAADVSDKDSRMKQVLNELLSDLKKLI